VSGAIMIGNYSYEYHLYGRRPLTDMSIGEKSHSNEYKHQYMPTLKIKTEYIRRLKEMGVYDKWLYNVKDQWNDSRQQQIDLALTPADLINRSFTWGNSNEGHSFWYIVFEEICNENS
jgi:hypothetical protein